MSHQISISNLVNEHMSWWERKWLVSCNLSCDLICSCGQEERCSYMSAVLTDDSSIVTTADEEMEHIGILSVDPGLELHKDHFKYRVRRYADQIKLFEKHEGGLEEFAKGDLLSY